MLREAETFQFVADKGDSRLRLDRILVRRVTDVTRLSRTTAQQWIADGAVQVDGVDVRRPAARVQEGARVSIAVPASAPRRTRPEPEPAALDVIFQDDSLLVVNKPAGVVVHPSYRQASGTMLNAVLWRLQGSSSTTQPGIVTRLDKDTSGLVLIALAPAVHATLQRDAAAGRLEKRYLALVAGVPRPQSGRIREPIGRDPLDRRRMRVSPDGAPSETRYEVLARGSLLSQADDEHEDDKRNDRRNDTRNDTGDEKRENKHCALVMCTLVTGRTHQIRVHLASQRWPILGDRVYGVAHPAIARQALHAWTLSLRHPVTGAQHDFEAPLPPDMRALLDAHGTMPAAASLQETAE